VVRVPSGIVEPLILASIAVMFALNIMHKATSVRTRAPIVFACGLLHGLGFASSIADIGLHGAHKLASLIGFNLGIELGQGMIVAAALSALALAHHPKPVPPLILSAPNS